MFGISSYKFIYGIKGKFIDFTRFFFLKDNFKYVNLNFSNNRKKIKENT